MQIEKFGEKEFEELKNINGNKSYKWNTIHPKSWNHWKKEYVAIIECCYDEYDGLKRKFISERSNFSGSGKNAELHTVEPTEDGTLIEIKDGSHKHMVKTIYRKENDKWRKIATREGRGGYFGGGNLTGWKLINE